MSPKKHKRFLVSATRKRISPACTKVLTTVKPSTVPTWEAKGKEKISKNVTCFLLYVCNHFISMEKYNNWSKEQSDGKQNATTPAALGKLPTLLSSLVQYRRVDAFPSI